MNEEIPKEAQCEKVQGSVDSISESKILDLKQLPRLEQGGDFASYFALNRLTQKMEDHAQSIDLPPLAEALRKKYHKYKNLRKALFGLYILMTIFQRPVWCNFNDYDHFCTRTQNAEPARKYSTMVDFYLPLGVYYTMEIIIVIILTLFKVLKAYTQNSRERRFYAKFQSVLTLLIIINDIVVLATTNGNRYNFSTLLKPFYMIAYSHLFQLTLRHYIQVIQRGKDFYLVMIFSLVFFYGFGQGLFKYHEDPKHTGAQNDLKSGQCDVKSYPYNSQQSWYCTLLLLFQLQTTVNSPDVYLIYYNDHRAYVIYFILYQFVNTLLIINMIVAVFYSAYKSIIEEQTKTLMQYHQQNLTRYMSKFLRKRSQSQIILVAQPNQEESECKATIIAVMSSPSYEYFMEFLSLLIFVLIFLDFKSSTVLWTNIIANLVFLLESLILISFMEKHKLHKHKMTFVHLTLTIAIITSSICALIYPGNKRLIRISLIMMSYRLFRGCKWLLSSKQFTTLLEQLISIFSYVVQLFGMLFILFMIFTALGQLLFGGKIFQDEKLQPDLPFYYLVSFNDFLSGLCTCWFLMIINNWNFVSSFYATQLETDLCYIYFIVYYIVVVILTLNVTLALLIDYLVNRWQQQTGSFKNPSLVEPLRINERGKPFE